MECSVTVSTCTYKGTQTKAQHLANMWIAPALLVSTQQRVPKAGVTCLRQSQLQTVDTPCSRLTLASSSCFSVSAAPLAASRYSCSSSSAAALALRKVRKA